MAKIKTTVLRIDLDGMHEQVELSVFYTERDGFFGLLPERYKAEMSGLQKNKAYESLFTFKTRGKYSIDYNVIRVSGSDIKTVTDNAITIMELILKAEVKRRPIIMIHCYPIKRWSYDSSLNHDHQLVGIELGLKYCYEVRRGDAAPTYATMKVLPAFDDRPEMEDWREFRSYGKDMLIIDDTPENRTFVEDIYSKLKALIEKLGEISDSTDNFLEFIGSSQKLLG